MDLNTWPTAVLSGLMIALGCSETQDPTSDPYPFVSLEISYQTGGISTGFSARIDSAGMMFMPVFADSTQYTLLSRADMDSISQLLVPLLRDPSLHHEVTRCYDATSIAVQLAYDQDTINIVRTCGLEEYPELQNMAAFIDRKRETYHFTKLSLWRHDWSTIQRIFPPPPPPPIPFNIRFTTPDE